MKKLRKGLVHPSLSLPIIMSCYLSLLPATILTLTAALSPQDREVLAYLIFCSTPTSTIKNNLKTSRRSSSAKSGTANDDHPSTFNCDCFRCYMSYWARWDSSPNRQLIHEIIDAYEDGLTSEKQPRNSGTKKEKRNKRRLDTRSGESKRSNSGNAELGQSESMREMKTSNNGSSSAEEVAEKGPLRRFLSFIAEKIWGVWDWWVLFFPLSLKGKAGGERNSSVDSCLTIIKNVKVAASRNHNKVIQLNLLFSLSFLGKHAEISRSHIESVAFCFCWISYYS